MTTRQLHHLDRALDRRWAQGLRARDTILLDLLRARVDTVALAEVGRLGSRIGGAQLLFDDGFGIRLGPCHPMAAASLSAAVASRTPVLLIGASRQRHLWSLAFAGERRLSLLARSATPVPGGGTLVLAAAA